MEFLDARAIGGLVRRLRITAARAYLIGRRDGDETRLADRIRSHRWPSAAGIWS